LETLDQKPQQQTKTGKDGREVVLSVEGVTVGFNGRNVLEDLNLDVYRGEILGFIGPSGAGKSVLMRTVLRLLPRQAGTISILGSDYDKAGEDERMRLDQRLGVLFQQGALFSGLTVK
jgi:phospholipid/cholesterol/gamma-HCH transport system ATP-binding protein